MNKLAINVAVVVLPWFLAAGCGTPMVGSDEDPLEGASAAADAPEVSGNAPSDEQDVTWDGVSDGTSSSEDGSADTAESASELPAEDTDGQEATDAGDDFAAGDAAAQARPPAAPSELEVWGVGEDWIDLSWFDESDNERLFRIQISLDGASWSDRGTLAADEEYYTAEALTPGTHYYFRVRAENNAGPSAWSNVAEGSTLPSDGPTAPPVAPSELEVWDIGEDWIEVTWFDESENEVQFRIQISPDGASWSDHGTVAADEEFYTASGLSPNTRYYFRVRAENAAGPSAWAGPVDGKTAEPDVTGPPAAPSGLEVSGTGEDWIELSWVDESENEERFRIQISLNGQNWSDHGTVGADEEDYTAQGLNPNTRYYFRVRAENLDGASAWTTPVDGTTEGIPCVPPAPPTILTAAPAGPASVLLTWQDNSADETRFQVARKTGENGSWANIADAPANATSYRDTHNLQPGVRYYYRVRAVRDGGDCPGSSEWSNVDAAVPQCPGIAAPSGFNAARDDSTPALDVLLTWTDNSADETRFQVARKTGENGSWANIADAPANAMSYRDTHNLQAGVRYCYRVRAVRDGGDCPGSSEWSNEDCAIPRCPDLAAPSGLNAARDDATPALDVLLTWQDNSADETRFQIARKTGENGSWANIADAPANATSYRDTHNLQPGVRYYYRVRAVRDGGDCPGSSEWSNVDAAVPQCPGIVAPSGFNAARDDSTPALDVLLTWQDNSADETRFQIARKTGENGSWANIADAPANATSYRDTHNLQDGVRYYYRVRAVRDGGDCAGSSEWSNVDSAIPQCPGIAAPSGFNAARDDSTPALDVLLTWTDNSADETRFQIARKTGDNGSWSNIADAPANATSYRDTHNLQAGVRYYYRVRAVRDGGDCPDCSEWSEVDDAIPR